jgi:hypothetical protein
MKRLRIVLSRREAIVVHRVSIGKLKLAYVLCADKKIKYNSGRSKIVYIGTTKNGIDRLAQSSANQSDIVLRERGINTFSVNVVTCSPRQNVKTWRLLERALILQFKEMFGEAPACNTQGKNTKWNDELSLFARERLRTIIEDLS